MPSRKAGPVLYELIRDSSRPATGGPAAVPSAEPEAGPSLWNWAGRTIRVPAGYVFAVAAVVVAVGMIGYVIGYGRAEQKFKEESARQARQAVVTSDPLDDAPLNLNLTAPRPEESGLASGLETNTETDDTGTPGPAEAEPADPTQRQAGLNYYVIVRDLPAEGQRLVAWLDSRGIPAVTEPVSGGLVKVIVVEGFARGQASSAQALSYKEHLRELGRRWKREHRGSSDFSDLYLEKFQG